MTDTFQVGEIAILQNCFRHPQDNGDECEIVALPLPRRWTNLNGKWIRPGNYLISHQGRYWQVRPDQLRKKPPPVKREACGEWDLCPWQPAKMKTTAQSEDSRHGET